MIDAFGALVVFFAGINGGGALFNNAAGRSRAALQCAALMLLLLAFVAFRGAPA